MSGYVPVPFKNPIKELNNARLIVNGNYRYKRPIKLLITLIKDSRPGEIFVISPAEYPVVLDWLEGHRANEKHLKINRLGVSNEKIQVQ